MVSENDSISGKDNNLSEAEEWKKKI